MHNSRPCLAILLVASTAAVGGDREIYQQDSFIDPRYLGANMTVNGPTQGGTGFETFGASVGVVGQYQDRDLFTATERQFVDVLYDRYWKDYQVGAELTEFQRRDGGTTQRGTIEFGRYALNATSDRHEGEFVSRWLAFLTVDDRLGLGTQYEAGLNAMVELPIPKFHPRGGTTVSYRVGSGVNLARFMWQSSEDLFIFSHGRGRLNGSFTLGIERDHSSVIYPPLEGKLLLEYRAFEHVEVHVGYAPAISFSTPNNGRRFNNQWILTLYRPIGSRLLE